MRITHPHGVEGWDGSVTPDGDLRVTVRVGPFPVVGVLPVEVLVHPWEALPGTTCVVPFHMLRPVRCAGRLIVTNEEIRVETDSGGSWLESILRPLIQRALGPEWKVTP